MSYDGHEPHEIFPKPVLKSNQYGIPILNALRFTPKSAYALSADLEIPVSACYRVLKGLQELGLVVVYDRPLTREGKRYTLYLATVAYAPSANYARFKESADRPK